MSDTVATNLKRKRTAPFSAIEKNFVKDVVLKYKRVVENKNSDTLTLTEKKEAWKQITKEFNCIPQHTQRTEKQLRKCWDNLKSGKKKEIELAKKVAMAAGVGTQSCIVIDHAPDIFQPQFETEIDVIDKDPLTLVATSVNEISILSGKGTLEATTQDVVETEVVGVETTSLFTGENEIPHNGNHFLNIAPPTTSVPATTTSSFLSHTSRGGKRGVHRKVAARLSRVKGVRKQDSEIRQYLVREAKYKAMAAEVVYKEKMALLQKAELEVRIKQLELKMLQDQIDKKLID